MNRIEKYLQQSVAISRLRQPNFRSLHAPTIPPDESATKTFEPIRSTQTPIGMKNDLGLAAGRAVFSIGIAGFAGAILVSSGCAKANAADRTRPLAATTGPLELSIYKEDFAMVHEKRPLDLQTGSNHVRLGGVSKMLDPNSVDFKTPSGTEVTSTTYDLGIGTSDKLLQRLAGKEVELIWTSDSGKEGDHIKGILEPSADGGFLLRSGDKVYVNPKGTIVAAADAEVDTMPGLAVQLDTKAAGHEDLNLSYLTRGMAWQADYVAHMDTASGQMKLECWASVTNSTGIPYKDAKLTFVAGQPNRAAVAAKPAEVAVAGLAFRKSRMDADQAPRQEMTPMAVGELYEYKAEGTATLGVDQISRVKMFDKASVPIKVDYSVALPAFDWWQVGVPTSRISAQMGISFDNREASQLGFPLPSGAVRVFESDGNSDRYTGADTIADLPKEAHANLTLSKVFDISAEPAVVKSERIAKHLVRKTIRVVLRNEKKSAATVRVVQEIESTSPAWRSGDRPIALSAGRYQWKVSVPAGGTKTVTSTFDLRQ